MLRNFKKTQRRCYEYTKIGSLNRRLADGSCEKKKNFFFRVLSSLQEDFIINN
jgi:hypothetical protein